MHLGAEHPVTPVFRELDGSLERIVEARPARPALKLAGRGEERLAASGADEGAGPLFVIQSADPMGDGGLIS